MPTGDRLKLSGFHATSRAHAVNEDLAHVGERMAWLIDGATPVGAGPQIDPVSDARWFVHQVDVALREHEYDTSTPLPALLAGAVESVRDEISRLTPSWPHPPSGAIAIVRIADGAVEYFRLAEVSVAIAHATGLTVAQDVVSRLREEYLVGLERAHGPDAARQSVLERRRTQMNRTDGYWVLADDPAAVAHGEHRVAAVAAGDRMLLASDGLVRAVDTFGICTWDDLMSLDQKAARDVIGRLRIAERGDPDRVSHPRVSAHDDATGIWLQVQAATSGAGDPARR